MEVVVEGLSDRLVTACLLKKWFDTKPVLEETLGIVQFHLPRWLILEVDVTNG